MSFNKNGNEKTEKDRNIFSKYCLPRKLEVITQVQSDDSDFVSSIYFERKEEKASTKVYKMLSLHDFYPWYLLTNETLVHSLWF